MISHRILAVLMLLVLSVAPPAAGAPISSTAPTSTGYVSPTTGTPLLPTVTRPYAPPSRRMGIGHRGVDLLATPDSLVFAAGDGTVTFVGPVALIPTISVTHRDGIKTTYQPVQPLVVLHQSVKAGQPIGTVDSELTTHMGLHWGALTGKKRYMNPLHLLVTPQIRLVAQSRLRSRKGL